MPNPAYNQTKILNALEIIQNQVEKLALHVDTQNGRVGRLEEQARRADTDIAELTKIVKKTASTFDEHNQNINVFLEELGGSEKLANLLHELLEDKSEDHWREKFFSRIYKSLIGIAVFLGGIAALISAIAYVILNFFH
jgi:hypothetical protein